MNSFANVIPSLDLEDWYVVLELRDAYFHMVIHPGHRRILRVVGGGDNLQFTVPPFSLPSVLKVFTKCVAVVEIYPHC